MGQSAMRSILVTLMGVVTVSCGVSHDGKPLRTAEVSPDIGLEEGQNRDRSVPTDTEMSQPVDGTLAGDGGPPPIDSSTANSISDQNEMGEQCVLEHEIDIGQERIRYNGSTIQIAALGETILVGYRVNQTHIRFLAIGTNGHQKGESIVLEVPDVSSLRHIETIGPYFVAIAVGWCPKKPVECIYSQLFSADGKMVGDLDISRRGKIGASSLIKRTDDELLLEYRLEKCGYAFYSLRLSEAGGLNWSLLKDMCAERYDRKHRERDDHWVAMYLSDFLVAADENFWVGITDVDQYTRESVGGNASVALVPRLA
jgi:hypothetical protein